MKGAEYLRFAAGRQGVWPRAAVRGLKIGLWIRHLNQRGLGEVKLGQGEFSRNAESTSKK